MITLLAVAAIGIYFGFIARTAVPVAVVELTPAVTHLASCPYKENPPPAQLPEAEKF